MITNNPLHEVMSNMLTDVSLNCELAERLLRDRSRIFTGYFSMELEQKNLAHIQLLDNKIKVNKIKKFVREELNEELEIVIQSLLEQV